MSHAIHYAEAVTDDVLGPKPTDAGSSALPWDQIIAMVLQVVTQLLANCPKKNKLVDVIRKPGRLSLGRFQALVYDSCQCCSPTSVARKNSGAIADAMVTKAQALTNGEILGLAFEIENSDWDVI
jgi:hypothetical protein